MKTNNQINDLRSYSHNPQPKIYNNKKYFIVKTYLKLKDHSS